MAPMHPPASRKTGFVLAALTAALVLVSACGSSQSAIDDAVNATRTADQQAANAVASAVAETLNAAPTWTPVPLQLATQGVVPATASVCSESMEGLAAIAMTYLEGGRFMVALEKDEAFIVHDYVLLVNDARYECGPLTGQPANRIYCIGRPIPPVGHARVEMVAARSSCSYEIPFSSINVPPRPVPPTSAGGYP